jgi:hypothetical protein
MVYYSLTLLGFNSIPLCSKYLWNFKTYIPGVIVLGKSTVKSWTYSSGFDPSNNKEYELLSFWNELTISIFGVLLSPDF